MQVVIVIEIEGRQIGQARELFRDAAWHTARHNFKSIKISKINKRSIRCAEQLTVEAAVDHVELLEVRESAPFRRNSTSELVRGDNRTADIEHLE